MSGRLRRTNWTRTLIAVLLTALIGLVGLTGCSFSNKDKAEEYSGILDTDSRTDGEESADASNEEQEALDGETSAEGSNMEQAALDGETSAEGSNMEQAALDGETSAEGSNTEQAELDGETSTEGSNTEQAELAAEESTDVSSEEQAELAEKASTEVSNTEQAVPGNPEGNQKIYFGEWVINRVQAYGVGTYSQEDVDSLIGKSMTFTKETASVFTDKLSDMGKVAENPTYTETVLSAGDVVAEYRISLENLGIESETVTKVVVTDANGYVSSFIIKDDNTLILIGGGTYFELLRKDA